MHKIQKDLLALSRNINLGDRSLREIGSLINVDHPQKISHHLDQLERKGFLYVDRDAGIVKNVNEAPQTENRFINIPIVGNANCGPATMLATENIEGHLKVSKSTVSNAAQIFAVKASGDSMNRCDIRDKPIADGDYVLIDSDQRDPKHGGVYLFLIDGAANIKRYYCKSDDDDIYLLSESSFDYPPIQIKAEDADDFEVNGKVVEVIQQLSF